MNRWVHVCNLIFFSLSADSDREFISLSTLSFSCESEYNRTLMKKWAISTGASKFWYRQEAHFKNPFWTKMIEGQWWWILVIVFIAFLVGRCCCRCIKSSNEEEEISNINNNNNMINVNNNNSMININNNPMNSTNPLPPQGETPSFAFNWIQIIKTTTSASFHFFWHRCLQHGWLPWTACLHPFYTRIKFSTLLCGLTGGTNM